MLAEELQLAGLVGGEQLLKHQPTFQACHSAPRVGDWPWGDTDGHGMIGAARGRPTGRRIATPPRCLPRASYARR